MKTFVEWFKDRQEQGMNYPSSITEKDYDLIQQECALELIKIISAKLKPNQQEDFKAGNSSSQKS